MTKALDKTSTHHTRPIVIDDSNLVFPSEWDNFSKTTTNLTCSNVVNSAARIIIQEVKHGLQPPAASTLPEYERDTRNQKTNYKVSVLETVPPLTMYTCAGSKFTEDAFYISPPEKILEFNECLLKSFAWLFYR